MFRLIKIENGRMNVPEPEFLTVSDGIDIKSGEAISLSGGKVGHNNATTKPYGIAMADKSTTDSNRVIPICRIESNQVYECDCIFSTGTYPAVGSKVTLAIEGETTAVGVTATITSGVATVVPGSSGSKSGDKILVRFV